MRERERLCFFGVGVVVECLDGGREGEARDTGRVVVFVVVRDAEREWRAGRLVAIVFGREGDDAFFGTNPRTGEGKRPRV